MWKYTHFERFQETCILNIACKWASKSGGKALKKLVKGWKFGPNYRLIVFFKEVDVLELKVCDRLGGKKNKEHSKSA